MRNALQWLVSILLALIVLVLIKTFVIWRITVADQSMSPTIESGDRLLLHKLGTPDRNDLGVFLSPDIDSEKESTQYLKRVVAIPGDTFRMVNQRILINDEMQEQFACRYDYYVQTNNLGISDAQKEQYKLYNGGMVSAEKLYSYSLTDSVAMMLEQEPNVQYVERKILAKGIAGKTVAQFAQNPSALAWNVDNFGPLVCPRKGMVVVLNDHNLNVYASVLERFENKKIKKVDELYYVNNIVADSVYFSTDYYFFLGDNRHQSKDSRFFGLVPREKIKGVVFSSF